MTFFTHGKFPWIARALIGCWHCLIACQGWDLQLYLGFGDVRKLQKILFIILQYFFINANMRSQLVFQVEYLHCCFYFISFMVNNIVYREFLISGVKKSSHPVNNWLFLWPFISRYTTRLCLFKCNSVGFSMSDIPPWNSFDWVSQ